MKIVTELSLAKLARDNSVAISLKFDKIVTGLFLAKLARDNSVAISSKFDKNSDRIVPSKIS